jgi:hypothetical protein
MNNPMRMVFTQGRPFYDMVMSFIAATVGLGPLFNPENPLALSAEQQAWYLGKLRPDIGIDLGQVRRECISGTLSPTTAVKALCCMLLTGTFACAEDYNDHSPEFEFFRHLRNAASHGNRFNFHPREPRRMASWSGCAIDHALKGIANPLANTECVGTFLSAAGVLSLLHDIEAKLP